MCAYACGGVWSIRVLVWKKFIVMGQCHVYRSLFVNKIFIKCHIKVGWILPQSCTWVQRITQLGRSMDHEEVQAQATLSSHILHFLQWSLSHCVAAGESHNSERGEPGSFPSTFNTKGQIPTAAPVTISVSWLFPKDVIRLTAILSTKQSQFHGDK